MYLYDLSDSGFCFMGWEYNYVFACSDNLNIIIDINVRSFGNKYFSSITLSVSFAILIFFIYLFYFFYNLFEIKKKPMM